MPRQRRPPVRTAVSTDFGNYTFTALPPGIYNVKTENQGFKSATSNKVEVQVQQTVRLNFALVVGQVSESIEVQASADQLQAENGTVGTVIENKGIMGCRSMGEGMRPERRLQHWNGNGRLQSRSTTGPLYGDKEGQAIAN